MKKWLSVLLVAILLLPMLALAEDTTLNVFTWEGYIDDTTIANFREQTGVTVKITPFASNEDMLAKLKAGGEGYDLVICSDYMLNTLRKEGLIQKLDKEKITNYGNLDPVALGQYFDPDDEYVIPYIIGTPLIVYDPARVTVPITSYADLWQPELANSIVVPDDARLLMGITLKSMGLSFNETDPAVLQQVKDKLMGLYGNIVSFNSDSPQNDLISGQATVGFTYTSFVYLALKDRPDLQVVYPTDGLGIGIDGLVIPTTAKNVETAHAFLNFTLDSQNAAVIAEAQMFRTPVLTAKEYCSEAYLNSPVIYVPEELMVNLEYIKDVGETADLFQQLYEEFKLQ